MYVRSEMDSNLYMSKLITWFHNYTLTKPEGFNLSCFHYMCIKRWDIKHYTKARVGEAINSFTFCNFSGSLLLF